jgi:hypothetical protein
MKSRRCSNRTRFSSILRIATAATLISAAAVMAVILGTEALVTGNIDIFGWTSAP